MPDIKGKRGSSAQVVASGGALTAGSRSALSSPFDNSTALCPFLQAVAVVTFGVAPAANRRVSLYGIPAHDGTNYADGSDTVAPSANLLLGWAFVRAVTTAQRLSFVGASPDGRMHIPFSHMKFLLLNEADQTISSAWTLDIYPEMVQSV